MTTFTETRKIQERTIIKEWKLRPLLGRIIIGIPLDIQVRMSVRYLDYMEFS